MVYYFTSDGMIIYPINHAMTTHIVYSSVVSPPMTIYMGFDKHESNIFDN